MFRRISVVFTIGLVTYFPVQLSAQPATSSQPEGEIVELSPFEVSAKKDVGYAALTSIGATRTNTPLIDLPQSVNIINQEFLNDAAPGELYDVLRYVSGVSIESNVGDSVMIRGYTVRSQYTDGLIDTQTQSQMGAEPFHFQRLEVLKGPSAIVYGSHAIGGVLNRVRKAPQWEASGEIGLRIGTNNQLKGELDATGPLGDALAYRLVGTYRDEDLVNGVGIDHAFAKRWTIMPMLTWRVSDKVQLKIVGEFLNEENFKHWGDNFMLRDEDGNFVEGGETTFENPSWGTLSRSFTVSDEDSQAENTKRLLFGAVEVEVTQDWSIRAVAQGNRWSHDVVDILPTGIQLDNQTMPRLWRNITNEDFNFTTAIDSTTDFELGTSEHTLLVIGQYFDFDNHTTRTDDRNRPNLDVFNPVYGYKGPQDPYVRSNQKNQGTSWSMSGHDHMRFFEGQFHVVLGARYDSYESQGFNHLTGVVVPGDVNSGSTWTYKGGLIYKFSEDISAYYNYSETFSPIFTLQPDGSSLKPQEGVINEIGLKMAMNDGRYSMTVSVYDLQLQNIVTMDPDPDRASEGWRIQVAKQTTKGVDLDLITMITPQWDLMFGASKLDIELPGTDRLPRNTPEETAYMWTRYSFGEGAVNGLTIGGGVNWQGESAGEAGNLYFFDSYYSIDLFAQYTYKQFNIALNVTNATDEWYMARGINRNIQYAGPERNVRLTVRYLF